MLKFLQFEPYHDPKIFDEQILGMMRDKTLNESIERLMRLLSCIMIRRTKATAAVQLPPRLEHVVRLRFTPEEKAYYEKIEQPMAETMEDENDELTNSSSLWLTALQQIHTLRLACNLGVADHSPRPALALSALGNKSAASQILSARLLMGDQSCQHCLAVFDIAQAATRLESDSVDSAYYSVCSRLFCASCAILFRFSTPQPCDCDGSNSPCSLSTIPLQHLTPGTTPMAASPEPDAIPSYISTKVLTLIADVKQHLDEKR
jgi:hypothetical protein